MFPHPSTRLGEGGGRWFQLTGALEINTRLWVLYGNKLLQIGTTGSFRGVLGDFYSFAHFEWFYRQKIDLLFIFSTEVSSFLSTTERR